MPNDRISEHPRQHGSSRSGGVGIGLARLRGPAPVFVGHGTATIAVHEAIEKASHGRRAVLVSGAPGTGKRTIAELLHHFAGADIPALETVRIDARGRIGQIGEFAYLCPVEQLSLEQQARLPNLVGLGRLVIGTRLELGSDEAAARLSPKLLRWCGAPIELPSLVERVHDLEALAMYFFGRTPSRRPFCGISADAIHCMRAYSWPGNGSELEAVIADALEHAAGPVLEVDDLPAMLRAQAGLQRPSEDEFSLELALRRAIDKAIRHARGNKRRAARLLGIGKSTLYRKLEEVEQRPTRPS
jgi:DNA-binding NtrC family response regulator